MHSTTSPSVRGRSALLGVLALLALASLPSAQGETGFLRGAGNLDLALSWTVDRYDSFWIGGNEVSDPGVGEVERVGFNLYAAYGIDEDLDLIVSGNYLEAEQDGLAGAPDESDFQDVLLAAKWRVLRRACSWGEVSLLLSPGIKIPLSDYQDNGLTAIGDGQIDLRGRVIGHVQTHRGLFASIETGYDVRDDAPHDEFPLHLTAGATLAERFTIAPFFSRVDSLGGTDIGPPGTNFFPGNEEDFMRSGVSAFVRINERFGLTGNWRTTVDGRNTGDVDGFSLGVVLRP